MYIFSSALLRMRAPHNLKQQKQTKLASQLKSKLQNITTQLHNHKFSKQNAKSKIERNCKKISEIGNMDLPTPRSAGGKELTHNLEILPGKQFQNQKPKGPFLFASFNRVVTGVSSLLRLYFPLFNSETPSDAAAPIMVHPSKPVTSRLLSVIFVGKGNH